MLYWQVQYCTASTDIGCLQSARVSSWGLPGRFNVLLSLLDGGDSRYTSQDRSTCQAHIGRFLNSDFVAYSGVFFHHKKIIKK